MTSYLPAELIDLAQRVVEENTAAGRTIAVAESCTGGLVCASITEVAGSSAVFDRGFVTYSNQSKTDLLNVQDDVLETFGAVSVASAWAMAQGALKHSNASVAVAISGIAGPGGGSEHRPVGTVVFAKAIRGSEDINAEELHLDGSSRSGVRLQAALIALELLLP